jgi:hypothetical protein
MQHVLIKPTVATTSKSIIFTFQLKKKVSKIQKAIFFSFSLKGVAPCDDQVQKTV